MVTGGILTSATGTTALASEHRVDTASTSSVTASSDPCGYWRAGDWLSGYTYWYRHCGNSTVRVHIDYYDGYTESSCFGPWEKRQLSWRTTNAYYVGLC
ncbi:DUF6355 family natural product biosynthesis protein [Amycolatopsis plumensis]|uniref:DUF6355 family natural product biosynthesis protein n=2 Tax=Amycolatopsis plumensis TaxID=236508 RepID=A0ABV5UIE2_9PSEU